MRAVVLSTLLAVGLASGPSWASGQPEAVQSEHSVALGLVLASQSARIAQLDPVEPAAFDTSERQWLVRRAAGPGIVDSRPLLTVTYLVGGKVAATWHVNTQTRAVELVR